MRLKIFSPLNIPPLPDYKMLKVWGAFLPVTFESTIQKSLADLRNAPTFQKCNPL
jgi:hypothetical protein